MAEPRVSGTLRRTHPDARVPSSAAVDSSFELSLEHQGVAVAARRLAEATREFAAEADSSDRVHPGMREALRASGLCTLAIPASYGGRFERVDPLAITVVREALMGVSAHLDSLFAMQGIGSYALSNSGSAALRRRWLPRIASLQAVPALALTEPDVGSDLRSITTALRTDGNSLVLRGEKAFITNAGDADFYTVLAREEKGHSLVLVPASAKRLRVVRGPELIAPHVLGSLEFDDVRVPRSHRIGAPGKGFALVLATLACFRVSVAGSAVGLAEAALAEAVCHARSREQFGKPLASLGSVGQALARSRVEIEAARALTYRAAAAARSDSRASLALSSMAKVAATEVAGEVVDRAVQVMGRFGLVSGSVIERLYRNARPLRIYEGATEVILDSLSRTSLDAAPYGS